MISRLCAHTLLNLAQLILSDLETDRITEAKLAVIRLSVEIVCHTDRSDPPAIHETPEADQAQAVYREADVGPSVVAVMKIVEAMCNTAIQHRHDDQKKRDATDGAREGSLHPGGVGPDDQKRQN